MLQLPPREGRRPATSASIPHRQLDQNPPPAVRQALERQLAALDGVERGPSLISVPGASALFLPACDGCNSRFGFMRGREFAHLHPPEDGSLHLTLAPDDLQTVLATGWGELHPWAALGRTLPNLAMVYAPRTEDEVGCVLTIVRASLANASTPFSPLSFQEVSS